MKKLRRSFVPSPVSARLEFEGVDQTPQGIDRLHVSKEYVVSVTEFLADLGRSGIVTRLVIHPKHPGARLRVEDAQAIKRHLLGDVEAVMLLGCDARAHDCQPPGTMLLWCLAPGETWPLGPQGELPAGTVPEMLRFRDAMPVAPTVVEEPAGEPDFVMGETEGAGAARVILNGVPVLDVQRARSGAEGWVEVAVRRSRASGRLRCLPVGGAAVQAPREGEFWFPEGTGVESLRTAEGFALRVLSGRVKVLLPKPEPAAEPTAPAEPPAPVDPAEPPPAAPEG